MKTKHETFEVLVPDLKGTAVAERVKVSVPMQWDESLQEWLLTAEAHQIIENTKARHMGLLLPPELKELRERLGCTQKEMGEVFQVGEKSWNRWETGKHRPSRSINLLLRALYEGEISINYLLKRAGKQVKDAASSFCNTAVGQFECQPSFAVNAVWSGLYQGGQPQLSEQNFAWSVIGAAVGASSQTPGCYERPPPEISDESRFSFPMPSFLKKAPEKKTINDVTNDGFVTIAA